jgi:hypothetical protein
MSIGAVEVDWVTEDGIFGRCVAKVSLMSGNRQVETGYIHSKTRYCEKKTGNWQGTTKIAKEHTIF